MKTCFQTVVFFIFMFFCHDIARAGIMLEPYFGYHYGNLETRDTSNNVENDKMSGMSYGARLGVKFIIPWLAIDYMGSSGSATPDTSASKFDYTMSSLGGTLGLDLIFGLRLFAGYGFSHELVMKKSSADVKGKGTYTKFGAALSPIPFFSFNVEYITFKYNKIDVGLGNGWEDLDSHYKTADNSIILATLSIPL